MITLAEVLLQSCNSTRQHVTACSYIRQVQVCQCTQPRLCVHCNVCLEGLKTANTHVCLQNSIPCTTVLYCIAGVRIGCYANGFKTTTTQWLKGAGDDDTLLQQPAGERRRPPLEGNTGSAYLMLLLLSSGVCLVMHERCASTRMHSTMLSAAAIWQICS